MTALAQHEASPGACEECRRRSWLLAALSTRLDYHCRDRGRLLELCALNDAQLMQAIGGRRRAELQARYGRFDPSDVAQAKGVQAICRHDHRYPLALNGAAAAPHMLNVAGDLERLSVLTSGPGVAIVGSRKATDYGIEMAKSLARGLAAAGVTITSSLEDGISVAALAGALEVDGGTVTVMPGGLDVACPARRRSLFERLRRDGCAVAELPCGCPARLWGRVAGERIVVVLAGLTVVVEADESPAELAGARIAQALGRTVAAVPGRVTSPASRGANALLMGGARLVRGPEDALELLIGMSAPGAAAIKAQAELQPAPAALEERLQATLERVGAGRDTPDKLASRGSDAGAVLMALSELELMGLLARGDGGRYVLRDALVADAPPGEP
jgi:DNA processing protein